MRFVADRLAGLGFVVPLADELQLLACLKDAQRSA
jgi:hypothetical protein